MNAKTTMYTVQYVHCMLKICKPLFQKGNLEKNETYKERKFLFKRILYLSNIYINCSLKNYSNTFLSYGLLARM